jgi:hypothetical protein
MNFCFLTVLPTAASFAFWRGVSDEVLRTAVFLAKRYCGPQDPGEDF